MHPAEQRLLSHVPSQGDLTEQKQNCYTAAQHEAIQHLQVLNVLL